MVTPRSFRASELAKELVRQGHKVKVATFENALHKQFSKKHGIEFAYLGQRRWKAIKIDGSPFISKIKRGVRRVLQLGIEYPDIELVGLVKKFINNEQESYDGIISIAVPHPIHWGVAASKWKRIAKTWIADCGDPYCGDTADSFKKLFYFKYVEKWAFKKADKITIPVEEGRKGYFPEFQSKINIIPQGFDLSVEKTAYVPNPIPTFIYAGSLIQGYRDPRPVLDYLLKLNQDFKFILYTSSNLVKPYVKKFDGKLEVRNYIPREELIKILSKADFLINFDNAEAVQSPSKLIDYKIACRPILNIKSGEIDKRLINDFLNGDYSRQLHIDNFGKYDIRNVVKEFIKLM